MDREDIMRQVYEDFFGNEKISGDTVKTKVQDEDKDKIYNGLIEKVDNLYLEDESKDKLKRILEYFKDGNKRYIKFNIAILTDNEDTLKSVISILEDCGTLYNYLDKGTANIYSMMDIEKLESLDNILENKSNIIAFKDLDNLNFTREKFLHKIKSKTQKEDKSIIILNAKNNEELNNLLEGDTLESTFSYFCIKGKNPDIQDAYNDIIEKIVEQEKIKDTDAFGKYKTFDDFKLKLLDYLSATYHNNDMPYSDYIKVLCDKITFSKDIPEYEEEKTLDKIFSSLDELVGLSDVKKTLRELADLIELKSKAKDLNVKDINLHMVFLGNPGTGKTTVARIVAQILYNLKYIKKNKLIEVTSKDLVGEYVGQTAPKTNAVIQKALGGVLFIDEAYSLASGDGKGNSYNEEAIATLIAAMENHRKDLVVIFAGYTKEMQDFLNSNSGIVSRIGYTLNFKDYTEDELIEIFKQMMNKAGFVVENDALDEVRKIIREYKDTKNFGNARFIRNVYEKSVIKHASNTKGKKSKKILKTITKEDISKDNLLKM